MSSYCITCSQARCSKKHSPEPEFFNIYWRLKSRLFEESCLFKVRVYSRTNSCYSFLCWLYRLFCGKPMKKNIKLDKIINICILYWKYLQTYLEALHTPFSPTVISKCLRIRAQDHQPRTRQRLHFRPEFCLSRWTNLLSFVGYATDIYVFSKAVLVPDCKYRLWDLS